jgi:hypothetical protein
MFSRNAGGLADMVCSTQVSLSQWRRQKKQGQPIKNRLFGLVRNNRARFGVKTDDEFCFREGTTGRADPGRNALPERALAELRGNGPLRLLCC